MIPRFLAPALAFAALASATGAQAQQTCLQPRDVTDTLIDVTPIAFDASMQACTRQFGADGFMRTKGTAFANRFRARQDASWSGAFRVLRVVIEQRAPSGEGADPLASGLGTMLASMSESAVRPFVDALAAQMIAQKIKPDTCGKIERAAQLVSPLPVENIGELGAFIAEQIELDSFAICPVPADRQQGLGKGTKVK
jgi:hypothetical protein